MDPLLFIVTFSAFTVFISDRHCSLDQATSSEPHMLCGSSSERPKSAPSALICYHQLILKEKGFTREYIKTDRVRLLSLEFPCLLRYQSSRLFRLGEGNMTSPRSKLGKALHPCG